VGLARCGVVFPLCVVPLAMQQRKAGAGLARCGLPLALHNTFDVKKRVMGLARCGLSLALQIAPRANP